MQPDDVVSADIVDQTLDIVLHGPEFAHKNAIVKTLTHTSIPIHPCTRLKTKKQTTTKTEKHNAQLTKHDPFIFCSSSCAVGRWATARKLGTCSSGLLHVGDLVA